MAAVIRSTVAFYREILELRDPRTKDWFLAGSPFPLLGILTAYWIFVFRIGPAFMKNRKPFQLDTIIQIYNALQVVVCAHLVYEGLKEAYSPWGKYDWFCEPVDYSDTPEAIHVASRVHIYYMLKVLDLMDTVFFVLRKKQSQVTFLHTYHHMGMTVFGFLGTVFLPGGNGVFIGMLNSFVHTVMYAYYFITLWNPEHKKNIWWKKHITQLQIVQFMMFALHSFALTLSPDCGYPKWTALFIFPQFFFFMILFIDFYRRTYK